MLRLRHDPKAWAFSLLVILGVAPCASPARAQVGLASELISDTMARRHGLTRAWAARVEVDPGRGRMTDVTLLGDALIAVTDGSVVHSFDAETGRTRWTAKIGRSGSPITPVGANEDVVAVCSGTTLYVLDRRNGRELMTRPIQGAPSAAPAVSKERVYVPTLGGGIETYSLNLKNPSRIPHNFHSKGSIEEAPLLAGDNLIWATHAGAVYSVRADDLAIRFRFMTKGEVTAGLGYWFPFILAASSDGFIYAIDAKTGVREWQFSTGYSARETPVALDGRVYAISELSGMFCLTIEKGELIWFTRNVHQFLSASATRLYTADVNGRLKVLDRASGAQLDVMPTERLPIQVHNIQTDRIYLGTPTGLIQCLHEIELTQPVVHKFPSPALPPTKSDEKPTTTTTPAAGAETTPTEPSADDPFGGAGTP